MAGLINTLINFKYKISSKSVTEIKEMLTNKVSKLNIDQELKDKITYNINSHISDKIELTEE